MYHTIWAWALTHNPYRNEGTKLLLCGTEKKKLQVVERKWLRERREMEETKEAMEPKDIVEHVQEAQPGKIARQQVEERIDDR